MLVNNAGIGYFSSIEEAVEEEVRKMFEINFWGLANMTSAVLPYMRNKRSGHIINISSIGGLVSFPGVGYYNGTKYAVEGISESLSKEVASFNIHVTVIEPSNFRTDWSGRSAARTQSAFKEYNELISICKWGNSWKRTGRSEESCGSYHKRRRDCRAAASVAAWSRCLSHFGEQIYGDTQKLREI